MHDRSRSRGPSNRLLGAVLDESAAPHVHDFDPLGSDDETAAAAARHRFRTEPMPVLQPDETVRRHLQPDEQLLAVRRQAIVDRRLRPGEPGSGLVGDLYLTSDRLLHVGRMTLDFGLDEIEQIVLSGDRLLLVMRNGNGVALEVDHPRLLRVEVATARAAARS